MGPGHTAKCALFVVALSLPGAVSLAGAPSPAQAPHSASQLVVTVEVEREVVRTDPSGRQKIEREPAANVRPGDILVYTVRADNRGHAPVFDVNLQDPIPKGTVLVLDSLASATPSSASLDGGLSWQPFPVQVKQRTDDGREEDAPAAPEAYTNLRWRVPGPVEAGAVHKVSFKARVL